MTVSFGATGRVSIIVPVLNEADGIEQLKQKLEGVKEALSEFGSIEFVFVDDGSTDGTLPLLKNAFPEGQLCRIISHDKNRGVGAAFRTGFEYASGNIVCTIDADCSYEPRGLKELIKTLEGSQADVAVASPYHPNGAVQGVGAGRLLLSRVCSLIYRTISPVPLYTFTSIFRAYRWSVTQTVKFQADGFVSAAEILIHAAEQGYRISEVPLVLRARRTGTTKMKILRTVVRHLSLMRTLALQRLGFQRESTVPQSLKSPRRVPSVASRAYQYSLEKEQ